MEAPRLLTVDVTAGKRTWRLLMQREDALRLRVGMTMKVAATASFAELTGKIKLCGTIDVITAIKIGDER